MRFKVDENLPREASWILGEAGHDAITVMEQGLGGEPDPRIYEICRSERRVLITLDLDFANIEAYPPQQSEGLIVLRLASQDKCTVIRVLNALVPALLEQTLEQRLWIVDETRIRMRA